MHHGVLLSIRIGCPIAYTYDLSGLQTDVTDSLGTISHAYDNALRLTSVIYPDGKTVSYQYDGNNNRTRLTYPDDAYVTYSYDQLNRITKIKQAGTTLLAEYDYDTLSRRTTLTYGNGNTTTYGYQTDNDLASLALAHAAGTATYTFTTNNIGIRTQTDIDDYRFVYRPASAVSTAYTPNALNQYTAVGSTSPTYDSSGNLTSDGTNTYTYDAQNRLIAAVTPDHTATYTYDPMGRRIEKEVDGTITQYLHDNDQVIVEYNASGTELRRYIYGPGIDEPICMITDSTTYYYHFDGLGSVVSLSDATGALQEIYAYTVFGQPNGTSYLGNPYLFTGREYDPETGLYYYRARFYDPNFGRFLQPDPIGYGDGMNVYAFLLNDPINFIDPWGLSKGTNPFSGNDPLVMALKDAIPKGQDSKEFKAAMKAIQDQLADLTTKAARKNVLKAAMKVGKAPAKYAAKYGIKLVGSAFALALDALWVDELNADEMTDQALWLIEQEIEAKYDNSTLSLIDQKIGEINNNSNNSSCD